MDSILHWGILSTGKISHDFVCSLKNKTGHKVVACGARTAQSAQDFAKQHFIPKAYGSYLELVMDPQVQVIYIGSISPQHLNLSKLAIEHGKPVLCEKPLCMNVKETRELIEFAREKNVFLMEVSYILYCRILPETVEYFPQKFKISQGIWSRCFPAYKKLENELNSIGEIYQVTANFGIPMTWRSTSGTMLDIGIYCVQFASFVFKGCKPVKIVAAGHLNSDGVDQSSCTVITYENEKTATLITHGKVQFTNDAIIYGTKGTLKVSMHIFFFKTVQSMQQ